MERTVLHWITSIAGGRPWVWKQDSAPYHVSNRSITWLQNYCYDLVTKEEWPPSSLDLNPMDYLIWGYLEAHTNRHQYGQSDCIHERALRVPPQGPGDQGLILVQRAYRSRDRG